MPEPQPNQLDLFEHSLDIALRNRLVDALAARDATAAHKAWNALQAEFADDAMLAPARLLVEALAGARPEALADAAAAGAGR
ncbi:MAG: hypothetical protein KGM91_25925, partial [Burkholderiales bacterium]|nr:hypothetical protein [Burkholderiales bacterium]